MTYKAGSLVNDSNSTQTIYSDNIKLKDDVNPSNYLTITNGSDLSQDRTLTLLPGDSNRTITFTGNATISGTNSGDQSIGLSAPTELSVSNSPITGSGTIGLSWADASQNTVFAAPTTGNGTPAFRSLSLSHLPNIDGTKIRIGSDAQGDIIYFNGTNYARLGAGTSGQFLQTGGPNTNPSWASGLSSPTITGNLSLSTSSTILIDGNPGWNDLSSEIVIKGNGSNDPVWTLFRDGIYGYAFSSSVIKETHHRFHLNHDYAPGTAMYPHIHWSPNTTSTGTVRWGFEYTVAKGFAQSSGSVFGATTTVYVEQNISSNSQYKHFVAEVSLADVIPSTNIEIDSLVLMRIFRDAAHTNDTFPDVVFAWYVDLHYQLSRMSSKNRTPDFYA